MSSSTENVQSIANCNVCKRSGLPILPLRYALTRSDGYDLAGKPPGPEVQGSLIDDSLTSINLPDGQHYTLRLLRGGFLYVYNQLRGRWYGYVVTEQGYLIEYVDITHAELLAVNPDTPQPIDAELQPPATEPEFACAANPEHAYPGHCIMIPNADRADTIYLAFSDAAWTKRVWKEHANNENSRRDSMRKISLAEWRGGSAPYADKLENIGNYLAEAQYHFSHAGRHNNDPSSGQSGYKGTAFSFSPFSFYGLKDRLQGLQRWAKEQGEPLGMFPMIVGMEDPVGIAAELAEIMAARLKEQMSDPAQARPLAISSAIANIRKSIREDAENRQIYSTEREAYTLVHGYGYGASGIALASAFSSTYREQQQDALERWRNPTPEQLASARDEAWKSYTDKLDMSRLESWQSNWQESLSQLDSEQLAPLAEAHVGWMSSNSLIRHMSARYDDKDIESGEAFVNAVLLCIQGTQEYVPCARLYQRWLSATAIEKENLALRALGYNQAELLDQWEGVVNGGIQPSFLKGLPWDSLISAYDNATKDITNGSQNAVVRLTVAMGGPLANIAGKAVDHVVGPALVAMGVIARAPALEVDVTSSRANSIAELNARMTAVNPKLSSLKDLNRAIDIQMRKARIYGSPVEGTGRHRYLILADPRVVEDFPGISGIDEEGVITARRFAEEAILTEADRAAMTRLRWRQLLPAEAGLGVVTGILQLVALGKLADDLATSMNHEKNENRWRYHTGIAGLVGTLGETVGKWSESAVRTGNRVAFALERYLGSALRITGKALGIAAGVVMALWDGIRGWKEIQEGNGWVGGLFIASAGFSLVAMGMFAGWFGATIAGISATGIGIVLIVFVIVIAVLIEIIKDNKLQDWMERCYFGKFQESERYQNIDGELEELGLALGQTGA